MTSDIQPVLDTISSAFSEDDLKRLSTVMLLVADGKPIDQTLNAIGWTKEQAKAAFHKLAQVCDQQVCR